MTPSNPIYIGDRQLEPDEPVFICPLCDCEADRPNGRRCPDCGEEVIPDPEDLI